MKLRSILSLISLMFVVSLLSAQESVESYVPSPVVLKRSEQPIRIDGKVDEGAWRMGSPARQFWEYFPTDSVLSDTKTEIFMTYDDRNLYIAAICYSVGDEYIINSLRRDFRAGGNDNITFILDPFQDQTNAFVFGMNPLGVRREALIANGGQNWDDFDESWDNKWNGASYIGDGFWSCELAIPYSTIRFKEGETEWNFNAYRFDMQSNTRTTWARIPQNQTIMSLAYMGKMIWDEPLKKQGSNVAVIPYASSGYNQDFEEGESANYNSGIGGDAKILVSSGMNLDLTFNPDFSQVEVDQQVINTDRFEIFFPERRQFFLENADLFSGFGFGSINPFFSRRIGVSRDTSTGQNIQNPILMGARLSGKLDNNWRLGLLNMTTDKDEANGLPRFNYSVAAVQRKVSTRSNLGMIFVNKQSVSDLSSDSTSTYDPFNRVLGLDYNLANKDNSVVGKVFYHQAFTAEDDDEDENINRFATGARIRYRKRKFELGYEHQYVGEGYDAQVGFVRRRDFFRVNPNARIFFYPKKGSINQHSINADVDFLWRPELGKTDHNLRLFWDVDLRNTGGMFATINNTYIYLTDGFDPTRTDSEELPGERAYSFTSFSFSYRSDRRKLFSYRINPTFGQFYNGYRYGLSGSFTYRFQPFGSININYNYSRIELPKPFASASLFLIGPRIDITFSKSLFWTTFLQYNSQIENFNINARFQWRFKPVSDLFLVYTDNYFTDVFRIRSRALILKL